MFVFIDQKGIISLKNSIPKVNNLEKRNCIIIERPSHEDFNYCKRLRVRIVDEGEDVIPSQHYQVSMNNDTGSRRIAEESRANVRTRIIDLKVMSNQRIGNSVCNRH